MTRQLEHTATAVRTGDRAVSFRVACVIDDLGTGGAQRVVTLMARELALHSVELVVISLGQRDEELETLLASGIEVHKAAASSLASPTRALRLFKLLRNAKPDLVHTHLLAAHTLGSIAARMLGIPVISTLHNVDPHPRFAGTWKRVAESTCLRFVSTRVIAVGPRVAASNAARLGGRHIDVLPNPLSVSSERFASGDSDVQRRRDEARMHIGALIDLRSSTQLLLTVGRLATEKGWPGLLDIVDALRRSHPDCKLLAVGDGPCSDLLTRAIDARGLGQHVHLLGRRDDVDMFYRGCDLFVLNSSIEGLPMALLEAMASGLPVVATRVGDVEHAAAADVATLIEAGRPEAMVEALQQVLDDPRESRRRAAVGRDRILEQFDAGRWSSELVSLYHRTTGRAAHTRMACEALTVEEGPDPVSLSNPLGEHGTPPLRIVEFVDSLNTGGAQELMALRARNANRMNYSIHIISVAEHDADGSALSQLVEGIHSFPSPHVFDSRRLVRICMLLRRLKPDVILTHLRTSNIIGALCGRLLRIPVVSSLHITYPELGLAHARRDWAERWALRIGATHVVAVGPMVAETHRERFGGKRIEVVPNPVELPADGLEPSQRRTRALAALALPFDPEGTRIVLSVGRLTPVKGVLESIRVMEQLAPSMPELRFVIVGDGQADAALRQHIEQSGLQAMVFLLGRSEYVRTWMAASDVLLQNSHAEGLPLVLLEAMSMHLPVVATGVGDVPWLLAEGECGSLIEPGDVAGTAGTLARVLGSPDEARERAECAYARVKDAFSVDRWLSDIDRLLRAPAPLDENDRSDRTGRHSSASLPSKGTGCSDPVESHD